MAALMISGVSLCVGIKISMARFELCGTSQLSSKCRWFTTREASALFPPRLRGEFALGSDKLRFAPPASRSSPVAACQTAAWIRDSPFPARRIPSGRVVVDDFDRVAAGDGDYAAGEAFGVENGSGDGGLRSCSPHIKGR